MAKLGPFSVEYAVDFRSGGDTTKKAFRKHIQEIEKIYGILNALNANAVSADDIGGVISGELQEHENSINPHPNWKPSLSFSDITGYISANQIRDNSIPAGKISGLSALIGGQIPPDKGDGITNSKLQETGYVKFNNGLIINWGRVKITKPYGEGEMRTAEFATDFVNNAYNVSLTYVNLAGATDDYRNFMPQLLLKGNAGFFFKLEQAEQSNIWDDKMAIEYIAIGV